MTQTQVPIKVTVTKYTTENDSEEDDKKKSTLEEITSRTSSTSTTAAEDNSKTASNSPTEGAKSSPNVGTGNHGGDSGAAPPSTNKGESDVGQSSVESTETSPVETTSLESSMESEVTLTMKWGQVDTASLDVATDTAMEKPEMTSLTLTIDPLDATYATPIPSSSSVSFLGLRAPHVEPSVGPAQSQDGSKDDEKIRQNENVEVPARGPFPEEPRGPPSNLELSAQASAELPTAKTSRSRQSDTLPDMSDILSGLFNVVGEGLNIATNYVKSEQKKKDQEKLQEEHEKKIQQQASLTSRINNRGPPRFTEIPFEAIPLEVLQSPHGVKPTRVQIQQRPFHSKRIKVTKTRLRTPKPPFASGIPLPELLIPEGIIVPKKTLQQQQLHQGHQAVNVGEAPTHLQVIANNGNVDSVKKGGFTFGDIPPPREQLPRPPPRRRKPNRPRPKQPYPNRNSVGAFLFPANLPKGEPTTEYIKNNQEVFPQRNKIKDVHVDNDDFDLLVHTYFPDVERPPPPEIESSIKSTTTTTTTTTRRTTKERPKPVTPRSSSRPPSRRKPLPTSLPPLVTRRPLVIFTSRQSNTTTTAATTTSTTRRSTTTVTSRPKPMSTTEALRPGTVVVEESSSWPTRLPTPPTPRLPRPPIRPLVPPPAAADQRPLAEVITSPPYGSGGGGGSNGGPEIFDVTVTAKQNYNGKKPLGKKTNLIYISLQVDCSAILRQKLY
jgi:hypothetical protein